VAIAFLAMNHFSRRLKTGANLRAKGIRSLHLFTIIAVAVSAAAVLLVGKNAEACAVEGHLERYRVGDSLGRIIGEMNSGCPSTIVLHAGMDGFVACEDARGVPKRVLLIKNGRVAAIRTGPDSYLYGKYCRWTGPAL
jgi:hypothetical protein